MNTITPYIGASIVIPNDNNTFAPTRGIFIGSTGDIHVQLFDNSEVTFTAVPVGTYQFSLVKVFSTGTTANSLILLY